MEIEKVKIKNNGKAILSSGEIQNNGELEKIELEKTIKHAKHYEKIKSDSKLFIQHHHLKKFRFRIRNDLVSEKDLPPDTIFGTTYLIKGNNIIQFYSYFDVGFSPRVEINMKLNTWVCKSEIINREKLNGYPEKPTYMKNDPEKLDEIEKYYSTLRDIEYLEMLIVCYLKKGFVLYTM